MRGKQLLLRLSLWQVGITPARAGKTLLKSSRKSWTGDHPRACGENGSAGTSRAETCGSPPRVRGKHISTPRKARWRRITPARAGKTSLRAATSEASEDHPRACGENWIAACSCTEGKGSPPRVRGKQMVCRSECSGRGITPARAGKTRRAFCNRWTARDHPRACGENSSAVLLSSRRYGSPPRVRGKRLSYP